jgi:uncharacterized protein YegP (UPF0339 family)
MATATKKSHGSKRPPRRATTEQPASSMSFVVFEDNGGSYRWKILAGDGATLGQSGDFARYRDAEQAALQVRDGAASARFEGEGGSSSGKSVAR